MKLAALLALIALGYAGEIYEVQLDRQYYRECKGEDLSFIEAAMRFGSPRSDQGVAPLFKAVSCG